MTASESSSEPVRTPEAAVERCVEQLRADNVDYSDPTDYDWGDGALYALWDAALEAAAAEAERFFGDYKERPSWVGDLSSCILELKSQPQEGAGR